MQPQVDRASAKGQTNMALNVAVVGMKNIGNTHADAHASDDLANLVAVCDVVKERAKEAADKHGVEAYIDLQQMLDAHPDLDIIDVCTGGYENGSWHYEPVIEALEAGKHVLCEKPLSNCIDEARRMVAKADETGSYLGCNLNHYFTEPAKQAETYIADDKIGQMLFCLHRMGFPGGALTFSPTQGKNADCRYFHMKAFLTHPFSIMRHFCGDITHVQAFCDQPGFRKTTSDQLISINSIHVKFASGCMGYLLSQRGDATFGLGGWWSVEVGGTNGTFCIENCVEKCTYWPTPGSEGAAKPEDLNLGESPAPTVHDTGNTDFNSTFARRIHAFLEDVTNNVPREKLRANGRDALAALEYTFAAMDSAEQGGVLVRPNPLPELKGDPHNDV